MVQTHSDASDNANLTSYFNGLTYFIPAWNWTLHWWRIAKMSKEAQDSFKQLPKLASNGSNYVLWISCIEWACKVSRGKLSWKWPLFSFLGFVWCWLLGVWVQWWLITYNSFQMVRNLKPSEKRLVSLLPSSNGRLNLCPFSSFRKGVYSWPGIPSTFSKYK